MNTETNATIDEVMRAVIASQITSSHWAAGRCSDDEAIDADARVRAMIAAALDSQAQQIEGLTAERDALKHGHRQQHDADSAELRRLCAERDALRARPIVRV